MAAAVSLEKPPPAEDMACAETALMVSMEPAVMVSMEVVPPSALMARVIMEFLEVVPPSVLMAQAPMVYMAKAISQCLQKARGTAALVYTQPESLRVSTGIRLTEMRC